MSPWPRRAALPRRPRLTPPPRRRRLRISNESRHTGCAQRCAGHANSTPRPSVPWRGEHQAARRTSVCQRRAASRRGRAGGRPAARHGGPAGAGRPAGGGRARQRGGCARPAGGGGRGARERHGCHVVVALACAHNISENVTGLLPSARRRNGPPKLRQEWSDEWRTRALDDGLEHGHGGRHRRQLGVGVERQKAVEERVQHLRTHPCARTIRCEAPRLTCNTAASRSGGGVQEGRPAAATWARFCTG